MKKIVVYFQDGEILEGTTENFPSNTMPGFWMRPADANPDVNSVFIAISAVKKVKVLLDMQGESSRK